MTALLMWGGLALAQPAEPEVVPPPAVQAASDEAAVPVSPDALRLLGQPEVGELVPEEAEVEPSGGPLGNGWPIALAIVAGGLLYLGRRKLLARVTADTGSELRIVGRTALGAQAGLAVVEVRGRDGNWRRLVVGTGEGAPSLVADLGEPAFGFLGLAEEEAASLDDGFAPLGAPDDLRAAIEHTAHDSPELDAHARKLIDEVLGERTGTRRSTFKTLA